MNGTKENINGKIELMHTKYLNMELKKGMVCFIKDMVGDFLFQPIM
jgi:hypothetical protein